MESISKNILPDLQAKKLPPLQTRAEMLTILQNEEYGIMPPQPEKIEFSVGDL